MNSKIHIIRSAKTWIDQLAIDQLNRASNLPGIIRAVGLPDLHPGKDFPIGAVFLTKDVIYPEMVGNDIGCGMGLWKSTLKTSKFKCDRLKRQLSSLDEFYDDSEQWCLDWNLKKHARNHSIGTIGGGNHFLELQSIDCF